MEMETEAKEDRAHTVRGIEKRWVLQGNIWMLNGDIQKVYL